MGCLTWERYNRKQPLTFNKRHSLNLPAHHVEAYRGNADECFTWARTARSDREREIFLEMARAWLDAAIVASHRMSPIKPTASLSRFRDNRKQQAKISSRLPAGGARRRYSRRPRNGNAKHQASGNTMAHSVFLALQ